MHRGRIASVFLLSIFCISLFALQGQVSATSITIDNSANNNCINDQNNKPLVWASKCTYPAKAPNGGTCGAQAPCSGSQDVGGKQLQVSGHCADLKDCKAEKYIDEDGQWKSIVAPKPTAGSNDGTAQNGTTPTDNSSGSQANKAPDLPSQTQDNNSVGKSFDQPSSNGNNFTPVSNNQIQNSLNAISGEPNFSQLGGYSPFNGSTPDFSQIQSSPIFDDLEQIDQSPAGQTAGPGAAGSGDISQPGAPTYTGFSGSESAQPAVETSPSPAVVQSGNDFNVSTPASSQTPFNLPTNTITDAGLGVTPTPVPPVGSNLITSDINPGTWAPPSTWLPTTPVTPSPTAPGTNTIDQQLANIANAPDQGQNQNTNQNPGFNLGTGSSGDLSQTATSPDQTQPVNTNFGQTSALSSDSGTPPIWGLGGGEHVDWTQKCTDVGCAVNIAGPDLVKAFWPDQGQVILQEQTRLDYLAQQPQSQDLAATEAPAPVEAATIAPSAQETFAEACTSSVSACATKVMDSIFGGPEGSGQQGIASLSDSAEAKPSADVIQKAAAGEQVTGDASVYNPNLPGEKSGGQALANGGVYNPNNYEAAVQTDIARASGCGIGNGAPCYALVSYGGNDLVVKVNDNGPLVGSRIIDLNQTSMDYFTGQTNSSDVLKGVSMQLLEGNNYTAGPVDAATASALMNNAAPPSQPSPENPSSDANAPLTGGAVDSRQQLSTDVVPQETTPRTNESATGPSVDSVRDINFGGLSVLKSVETGVALPDITPNYDSLIPKPEWNPVSGEEVTAGIQDTVNQEGQAAQLADRQAQADADAAKVAADAQTASDQNALNEKNNVTEAQIAQDAADKQLAADQSALIAKNDQTEAQVAQDAKDAKDAADAQTAKDQAALIAKNDQTAADIEKSGCSNGFNCSAVEQTLTKRVADLHDQVAQTQTLLDQYKSGTGPVMYASDGQSALSNDDATKITQAQLDDLKAKESVSSKDLASIQAGTTYGVSDATKNAAVLAAQGQGGGSVVVGSISDGARNLGASLFTLSSGDEAKAAALEAKAQEVCGTACVYALKVNEAVPVVGLVVRAGTDLVVAPIADGVNSLGAIINEKSGGTLAASFNPGSQEASDCAINGCDGKRVADVVGAGLSVAVGPSLARDMVVAAREVSGGLGEIAQATRSTFVADNTVSGEIVRSMPESWAPQIPTVTEGVDTVTPKAFANDNAALNTVQEQKIAVGSDIVPSSGESAGSIPGQTRDIVIQDNAPVIKIPTTEPSVDVSAEIPPQTRDVIGEQVPKIAETEPIVPQATDVPADTLAATDKNMADFRQALAESEQRSVQAAEVPRESAPEPGSTAKTLGDLDAALAKAEATKSPVPSASVDITEPTVPSTVDNPVSTAVGFNKASPIEDLQTFSIKGLNKEEATQLVESGGQPPDGYTYVYRGLTSDYELPTKNQFFTPNLDSGLSYLSGPAADLDGTIVRITVPEKYATASELNPYNSNGAGYYVYPQEWFNPTGDAASINNTYWYNFEKEGTLGDLERTWSGNPATNVIESPTPTVPTAEPTAPSTPVSAADRPVPVEQSQGFFSNAYESAKAKVSGWFDSIGNPEADVVASKVEPSIGERTVTSAESGTAPEVPGQTRDAVVSADNGPRLGAPATEEPAPNPATAVGRISNEEPTAASTPISTADRPVPVDNTKGFFANTFDSIKAKVSSWLDGIGNPESGVVAERVEPTFGDPAAEAKTSAQVPEATGRTSDTVVSGEKAPSPSVVDGSAAESKSITVAEEPKIESPAEPKLASEPAATPEVPAKAAGSEGSAEASATAGPKAAAGETTAAEGTAAKATDVKDGSVVGSVAKGTYNATKSVAGFCFGGVGKFATCGVAGAIIYYNVPSSWTASTPVSAPATGAAAPVATAAKVNTIPPGGLQKLTTAGVQKALNGTPAATPSAPAPVVKAAPQPRVTLTPQAPAAGSGAGQILNRDFYCITSIEPINVVPVPAGTPFPSGCYNSPGNAANGSPSSISNMLGQLAGKLFGTQPAATAAPATTAAPAVTTPSTAATTTTPSAPATTPIAPSVAFISNPASVASGNTAQLSWAAVGSTACTITAPDGSTVTSGSYQGSFTTSPLTATTAFSIACSGGAGSSNGTVTVTVK